MNFESRKAATSSSLSMRPGVQAWAVARSRAASTESCSAIIFPLLLYRLPYKPSNHFIIHCLPLADFDRLAAAVVRGLKETGWRFQILSIEDCQAGPLLG